MAVLLKRIVVWILKQYRNSIKKRKDGKIAVINYSLLGDTVFTISTIKAIKKKYPDFILICFSESAKIYREFFGSCIDIIEIERSELCFGVFAGPKIWRKLVNNEIYKILDISGDFRTISSVLSTNAESVFAITNDVFCGFYDDYIPYRNKPHLVNMYLDSLSFLSISESKRIKYEFRGIKDNSVVLHPFASWSAKEWGIQKFLELYKKLANNELIPKIIVPGNIEKLEEIITELKKNRIDYVITYNIDELINVIKKSSVLIGNDSGPIHIAAMLGLATFTIFGPTNPAYIINSGEQHEFIQRKISCIPSGDNKYCLKDAGRKGCNRFDCMLDLSVEEVFIKFFKFYNKLKMGEVND